MTASSTARSPEIGESVRTGTVETNVHDIGRGPPVVLLHGSGPGVSAWANWRLVVPALARGRRVIAPDLMGFGYSERPVPPRYSLARWVQQVIDLMDALDVARADVVGNSFGGAVALALAIRAPDRVRRLVLMGSVGVPFAMTEGLDAVWGYTPSLPAMRALMRVFTHDEALITDDLVRLRHAASVRPGVQEAFAAMFPPPRQRWIEALASHESDIRALPHPALVVHGRDDRVIPLTNAFTLASWLVDSQLHVFGRCGHWTQIEQRDRFVRLVSDFLDEGDRV